ncbi:undecaprenol diphosphatase, putative [Heliomicrobium modesticaldum Ice1]|uniref:Undecaprenyl-diphosphatase n=1 Tax=Heliobacterium modesticaldum (strain ATCC 51547 / Ice1) TaxID=498761 RepID=B0TE55_HELMI|nr:undecaprenyl-diphosphate phosphatase [Heliomicrobium modesticaldum]ABZ84250.1 undecaprenol diphosphatase, putative [Heliomicrobium modesticaldum Ice1]
MENLYIVAIILGIVEGLTEFIPVSSTGHMILVGSLLGFEGDKAATFEVFIQLGAILAVLVLYRDRFLNLILNLFADGIRFDDRGFTVWHVAIAMAPACLFGYLFHKPIKAYLFSDKTVLIGLVLGGLLMLAAAWWRGPLRPIDVLERINYRQALFVGLIQCLSLWPGFSRSGATIAGGMLAGMTPAVAAEFSFIVAVPMMAVATGYDMLKSYPLLDASDLPFFALGFVVSFVVAWAAIVWFLKLLQQIGLAPFAYYRFLVALLYGVLVIL